MTDTFFQGGDVQALIDGAGGVSVTVGSTTAKGIRNIVDDELVKDEVGVIAGTVIEVVVKTGTFTGLQQGAAITVEGTSYSVIQARRIEDGALTRVLCTA